MAISCDGLKAILSPIYRACKQEIGFQMMTHDALCLYPDTFTTSQWKGKRMLAIGDSQTAPGEWQYYLGKYLDMHVTTHAMGGARMVCMVDGMDNNDDKMSEENSSNKHPDTIDPNRFGVDILQPLKAEEVHGVDMVCVMGLYNEVKPFQYHYGKITDRYPQSNSFCGRFNYMIDRIRHELQKAGNKNCRIVVTNMHRCGSNPYQSQTSYEYGDAFTDSLSRLARLNGVEMCDLMHICPIDSTNWEQYHSGKTISDEELSKHPHASPERRDFLHLNSQGHLAVAHTLALWLTNIKNRQ